MQTKYYNSARYAIVRSIHRYMHFENVQFVYVEYKREVAHIEDVRFTIWLN